MTEQLNAATPRKPFERKRRKIRVPTESYFHNVALFYLERFSASSEMLSKVLRRRLDRAVRAGLCESQPGLSQIEKVVQQAIKSGLVNDQTYGAARAENLLRRGKSLSFMTQDLTQRGLSRSDSEAALEQLEANYPESDLVAAVNLARKRRIGPFRKLPISDSATREEKLAIRTKELAIMARAGHGYQIAARVIDASDTAQLFMDGE